MSFQELWARVEVLESSPCLAPEAPAVPSTSAVSMLPLIIPLAKGKAASSLWVTLAHLTPANIKKEILQGNDVNLASLLEELGCQIPALRANS